MDSPFTILTEEDRQAHHAERERIRRRKRRRKYWRLLRWVLALALLIVSLAVLWRSQHVPAKAQTPQQEIPAAVCWAPEADENTVTLDDAFPSLNAILVDLETDHVLLEKNSRAVISPASMTKVLTLLVASERIQDLDDTVTMTPEISEFCYANDCSVMGLLDGEEVTVRDLLYGAILTSGADACLCLAQYAAGSQDSFVDMMNDKLEELGLAETAHFTNCIGLYDPDHHCTAYDMAVILKAAMDVPLCESVLGVHTWDTAPTAQHPQGMHLSNLFLRRIEDHISPDICTVIAAKTGFVSEAGSCAVSCGETPEGHRCIAVTANAHSSWRAIFDHVDLYQRALSPAAPAQ